MNGERLREARRRAGLNQTELGRRVGLSQSMIGAIERNERSPSPETAQAIADALGIVLDSLADNARHLPDSPDALLENRYTAEGLRELASDRVLAASLDIQPSEWRALRSLVLPTPVTKDGYIALLITIRLVTGGRGTPPRDPTESP
ncbi:helix-turn-helix transcriptional regulator [Thiocapsa roseopersicina]|uniref:DNA-binding transcriptional regulator, XRE-family HTH domain n=1 Tax=Thiocapsa roseopersicina TaxID=1058 RepID=A0A1H3DR96_THIRO|nr:helix-turn-helix domain-containing protein [Thiocapsa roseopersicina]SDX68945.1 DNA-binding transcriptional regulator, XRE-family HTH domain [Thiocapsa roseopersicina]